MGYSLGFPRSHGLFVELSDFLAEFAIPFLSLLHVNEWPLTFGIEVCLLDLPGWVPRRAFVSNP